MLSLALAGVVALAVTLVARESPVPIELDVYPPPDTLPVFELTPAEGVGDVVMSQTLQHDGLAGARLQVTLNALSHEREALLLSLVFRQEGAQTDQIWSTPHPGNGQMRLMKIEGRLPGDILPGSVRVLVTLRKGATHPAPVAAVSAALVDETTPLGEISPARQELLGPNWSVPEGYVRPLSQTRPAHPATPILSWNDRPLEMETVQTDTARFYDFELAPHTVPHAGNAPRPTHAYVRISADNKNAITLARQTPPNSWLMPSWSDDDILVNLGPGSTMRWAHWSPGPVYAELMTSPQGGPIEIRTAAGTQVVDLASDAEPEWRRIAIPPQQRIQRFRAEVPRKALGNLTVGVPDAPWFPVHRIFIGGFAPVAHYNGRALAYNDDLRVHSHWEPDVQDGRAEVPTTVWHSPWAAGVLAFTATLVVFALAAALTKLFRARPRTFVPLFANRGVGESARRKLVRFAHATVTAVPLRLCALLLVIAAVCAAGIVLLAPNDYVEIGLDVMGNDRAQPALVRNTTDGPEVVAKFERIPNDFAPAFTSATLHTSAERNPDAQAAHVLFDPSGGPDVLQNTHADPWWAWSVGDRGILSLGGFPSSFSFESFGGPTTLYFRGGKRAGIVEIETSTGKSPLDLYRPATEDIIIQLPATYVARYYAKVKRGELDSLRIQLPGGGEILRLYIASLIPQIYFADSPYPIGAWGAITESWRPTWERHSFALPYKGPWAGAGLPVFLALTAILFALAWCATAFARRALPTAVAVLRRQPLPQIPLKPFSWRYFLLFFVPLLTVFSFYLALYYPAILAGDTHHQWNEIQTREFKDNHPLLHTLYLMGIRTLWDSWTAIALVQVVAMAAALAYAFTLMQRMSLRLLVLTVLFLAALFSIRNGTQTITIWKDTPYSILVFLFTVILAQFVFRESWRNRWLPWLLLGLVLGLIPLIRHNGLALLVAMPPLLLLVFWREWKRVAASILIAASIFIVAKQVIYPQILVEEDIIEGVPNFYARHKNLRETRHILAQDIPIPSTAYAQLASLGILQSTDRNDLYTTGTFDQFKPEREAAHKAAVIGQSRLPEAQALQAKLAARFPFINAKQVYVGDRWDHIRFLFGKLHEPRLGFFVPSVREVQVLGDVGDRLHGHLLRARTKNWALFNQPVFHWYIALLATITAMVRWRDWRVAVLYMPVVLNSAALVVASAGTSDRYHYPLELALPFLVGVALLTFPERGSGSKPTGPGPVHAPQQEN